MIEFGFEDRYVMCGEWTFASRDVRDVSWMVSFTIHIEFRLCKMLKRGMRLESKQVWFG